MSRGFSLIEVLIVSSILLVFFTGLFGSVRYTLALISDSKAKLTALTVANDQMEFIHSLSYNAVGTVLGIPAGAIIQVSTTTLNNIEFERRILIEFIDDNADGTGAADSNGITTDYKQAKVTVRWNSRGTAREVFLVSNIIPRSIETSVGGGTLRVNVFDAGVAPLPGASVRVINTTIVPAVDVTRSTNALGVALFGGAPAGPNYQIFVTAPGYSSEQTYFATTTNPNPTTQPLAVLEADISTVNFFIDRLSQLTVRTLASVNASSTVETFSNTSGIATSTDIAVAAGLARLRDTAGVHTSTGSVFLNPITPLPLSSWNEIEVVASTPSNTALLINLYTGTSTYTLIPDSDLPGNSAGFAVGAVDISVLDVIQYPAIVIGALLSTANPALTPVLDSLTVAYIQSETVIANVPISIVGTKTIGTNAASDPIYKNIYNANTGVNGEHVLINAEWDAYTITATGYDIAEACIANPVTVPPNEIISVDLILVGNSIHTLRVVAEEPTGLPQAGATVTLSRPGFSETQITSGCGQVFFSGLTTAIDYTLTVSYPGYVTYTQTDVNIQNDQVTVVQF